MWSFISEGPQQFCALLNKTSLACTNNLIVLNVWNVISGFILFLMFWALIAFFMRYQRLDAYYNTQNITLPYKSLDDTGILKIHPNRLSELLNEKRLKELGVIALTQKLNEKYSSNYYLVLFREGGRTIARRELRLAAQWRNLKEHEFRTDPITMQILKKGSSSPLDDGTDNSVGVDGVFDVFVRKIRWWDIRHWVFHPNREVKMSVRVAVFIAALEYSSDIGKFLKSILTAVS